MTRGWPAWGHPRAVSFGNRVRSEDAGRLGELLQSVRRILHHVFTEDGEVGARIVIAVVRQGEPGVVGARELARRIVPCPGHPTEAARFRRLDDLSRGHVG